VHITLSLGTMVAKIPNIGYTLYTVVNKKPHKEDT